MTDLSVVITARDEQTMLPGCLRRLGFAAQIIVVVDNRTSDATETMAAQAGAVVLHHQFTSFADLKNRGLDEVATPWVLFVDADERVSRALASEMTAAIDGCQDAFRVAITNYFFGRRMAFGGWQEHPIRLFKTDTARFEGDIHELAKPRDPTNIGQLANPLFHFSHRSVLDNLHKTAVFGDIQAKELLRQGAPPVTTRRLYATMAREVVHRLVVRQGWRDGMPGVIESLYQPLSLLAVQVRLWELQQEPTIEERYRQLEDETW